MRIPLLIGFFFSLELNAKAQDRGDYWPFNQSLGTLSGDICCEVLDLFDTVQNEKILSTYEMDYSIIPGDTSYVLIHAPSQFLHLLPDPMIRFRVFSDSTHYEIELEPIDFQDCVNADSLSINSANAELIGFIQILNYLKTGKKTFFDQYERCWQMALENSDLIWLNGLLQYWGILHQVSSSELMPYRDVPITKYGFRAKR
jgi:hypothetical protein